MDLKNFLLDVDGVLTNGQFYYSNKGKILKKFGPHDADGLKIISEYLSIKFISADKRGFDITQKRISDMGFSVELVTEKDRESWVESNYNLSHLVFMGDGLYDVPILKKSRYSIAPNNAVNEAKKIANFTTIQDGGNGAVYEASLHLIDLINDSN
jgi:3-deoxy-D-manno-octulosonate 8-phosphate phosphatase (KDO 8-P phosphatase)